MRNRKKILIPMLLSTVCSIGFAASVAAESPGEQAVEAYKQELSGYQLAWGDIWVESDSVEFAAADLNGDGVLELLLSAVEGVSKHDGYYEIWYWKNGQIQKYRDITHYLIPESYDPTVSMICMEGGIKGITFEEYYSYVDGTLHLFLSHQENPMNYGTVPTVNYENESGDQLSEQEYQSLLTGAIGNGENLIPFDFVENTEINRSLYLASITTVSSNQYSSEENDEELSVIVPEQAWNPTDHQYVVRVEDCDWEEAAKRCEQMGGHLLWIDTPEEFYYVTDILEYSEYYRDKVFFIGGQREPDDTAYYWTDKDGNRNGSAALNTPDSWAYNYWGPGEPTFVYEGVPEYVLSIFKYQGLWILNDEPYSMIAAAPEYSGKMGYICEIEPSTYAPETSEENSSEQSELELISEDSESIDESSTNDQNDESEESTEPISEDESSTDQNDEEEEISEPSIPPEEIFSEMPELTYASGVGAWQTTIKIAEDGTFEGLYGDTDGYNEKEEYAAVYYNCAFRGQFENIRKVDEYTYTMEITSMEKWMDDSWSDPLVEFVFSEHPGLEEGDTVYLYLPGIPTAMLDSEYEEWVSNFLLWSWNEDGYPETMDGYGLYDASEKTSFVESSL